MAKRSDISLIIRSLTRLNEQRTKHIFSLVHGKPMIYGLLHEAYRKCGKRNCKCSEGKLHGPYHVISVNKQGKKSTVMIKRADVPVVLKEAKRYLYFQKTLTRIRKMNREIDALLSLLKKITARDYR